MRRQGRTTACRSIRGGAARDVLTVGNDNRAPPVEAPGVDFNALVDYGQSGFGA
jgi:hypothetical protein